MWYEKLLRGSLLAGGVLRGTWGVGGGGGGVEEGGLPEVRDGAAGDGVEVLACADEDAACASAGVSSAWVAHVQGNGAFTAHLGRRWLRSWCRCRGGTVAISACLPAGGLGGGHTPPQSTTFWTLGTWRALTLLCRERRPGTSEAVVIAATGGLRKVWFSVPSGL